MLKPSLTTKKGKYMVCFTLVLKYREENPLKIQHSFDATGPKATYKPTVKKITMAVEGSLHMTHHHGRSMGQEASDLMQG